LGSTFFLSIYFALKKASKPLDAKIRKKFQFAIKTLFASGLFTTGSLLIYM
jgi:hypothetical protein